MDKKLKTFLVWFWIILGVCLIITIVFFVMQFRTSGISGNPANWGTFGDYFGGIMQSIIALANLVIFVKLTHLLAVYQKGQSESELTMQKKIVMTQLKSDVVKNISEKLNTFFEIIKDSNQKRLDIINLAGHVDSFCKHNDHLFKSLSSNSAIAKGLIEIAKCYEKQYTNEEAKLTDIREKISTFYSERDSFIKNLQEQIINSIN